MAKYQDRINLRLDLLTKVYEHYFANKGAGISFPKGSFEEGSEEDLAYVYLIQKGLLEKEHMGAVKIYKMTPYGIDYVENSK
ncbi:hypothetical protein [Planococcus rifietoensis]|uniref:hypothetical protein n=1 Tax=Planococcus rifietoensis TaxID=200991 RepID=UPI00384C99E8